MAGSKRVQTISFLVLLAAVLILVVLILKPFVNILVMAGVLAILFHPVYLRLLKAVKYPSWASLITLIIIFLIIALPLWLFGQLLWNEISQAIAQLRNGQLVVSRDQIANIVPVQYQNLITNFSESINAAVDNFTSAAFGTITGLLSNIAGFVISTIITAFVLFFLIRDGEKISQAFIDISPIATRKEYKLFDRIKAAVNGVVKGGFVIALINGIVVTIGFLIFGLPGALLWGVFTVPAALIPTIGTMLTVVPAILLLLFTGHVPQAIGVAIWGLGLITLLDNLLRPMILGSAAKLHPVLVLLAVIGGLKFFGPLGFLVGPILMAVFVELVDMYRTDFKEYIQD